MAFSFKKKIEPLLSLFYPPLCLHCEALLPERVPLFCKTCLEQISLIDPLGRCRTCFAELYKGKCDRCLHRHVVIRRTLATCEPMGPGKVLLHGISSGKREVIPAAASLMAYQWLQQQNPLPDLLIPFPTSFWERQRFGFDPLFSLTQELSRLFSVPVLQILKKRWDRDHFWKTGQLRAEIEVTEKKKTLLTDKKVLLIALKCDDAALRSVGEKLKAHFPAQIEALSLVI